MPVVSVKRILASGFVSTVLTVGSQFPFNKLTSVFYASVLLLTINFVIILSKYCSCGSSGSANYFDNVMTKFIHIQFVFTITNCRIARSLSLTRRMNFKFMCLSPYSIKLAHERAWISAVIVKIYV